MSANSRGRRYEGGRGKLNKKKVLSVVIAVIVVIMLITVINSLSNKNKGNGKDVSLRYYSSYANGKWGVIDSKGNSIIDPTYDEMIVIPDSKQDIFIITENVDYAAGTYTTKAINKEKQELFSGYQKVEAIQNYDDQNTLRYESNVLRVQKDGKYGLINFSGTVLLNPDYDNISALIGIKNSLITEKDGKKGLVGTAGSVIINNSYQEISSLTKTYDDGYVVKDLEGKVGVISTSRKEVVPVEYQDVKHVRGGNTYIVKKEDKWVIYNSETASEIDFGYDEAVAINGDFIIVKTGEKYGLINVNGTLAVNAKYDSLKYVFQNYYIASNEGKYGIIDTTDVERLPFTYASLNYIEVANILVGDVDATKSDVLNNEFKVKLSGIVSEINTEKGYLKLRDGENYKYYNFNFEEKTNKDILTSNTIFLSKKDGKYGFINKDGVVVVNYIYDDATEQNDSGYAAVKKDGKWGAVDQEGRVVVDPKYSFENNKLIDFIGSWYLAEDLNAFYYTK